MGLFNENNFLNIALLKVWDIVLTNLLFIICCIPIITIGPAFTAMYHCTLRIVKGNNSGTLKTFFRAFKDNFKQSIIVWLGSLVIAAILYTDVRFLSTQNSMFASILFSLTAAMIILLVIINLLIYPVIAAFEGTLKMQLKNAFVFAARHFFKVILIFLVWTFPMATTYIDTQLQPLYIFCWFFFLFSTLAYINSFMLYKMFKPYLQENESDSTDRFFDDDGQAYLS